MLKERLSCNILPRKTPIKISSESYSQRRDLINNRLRLLARESLRRETIYIYEFPSWITNKDLFCRDEIHFTHFGMSKYYFAIKAAVLETRGIGTNKRLEKHNTSHSDDDLTTTPLASPTTDTVAETSSSVPSTILEKGGGKNGSIPEKFTSLSIKSMDILQKKKEKPNVLLDFAKCLGTRRPESDSPLLPVDRMPFGLIQYQLQFFSNSNTKKAIIFIKFSIIFFVHEHDEQLK
ncbi:unnamed protein product [Mytilus edulis]|uniref:Uncharacterized protein n=1 Tax=Mytilus edulis TaxID=6550 RepID=A0A8S3RTB7_MYTED|nr:unnamed protein product [Mytilus edulis]